MLLPFLSWFLTCNGTKWPKLCLCAVKKLLTHSLQLVIWLLIGQSSPFQAHQMAACSFSPSQALLKYSTIDVDHRIDTTSDFLVLANFTRRQMASLRWPGLTQQKLKACIPPTDAILSQNVLPVFGIVCHPPLLILEVCHYSRRLSIMFMWIYLHDVDGLSVYVTCLVVVFFLDQLLRVDLIKSVSNVRPYVRPSTKVS